LSVKKCKVTTSTMRSAQTREVRAKCKQKAFEPLQESSLNLLYREDVSLSSEKLLGRVTIVEISTIKSPVQTSCTEDVSLSLEKLLTLVRMQSAKKTRRPHTYARVKRLDSEMSWMQL